MKTILRTTLATAALACVLAVSPHAGAGARTPAAESQDAPPAEWTVMVYMNGDNNLEPDLLRDFREMAAVGSTDRVNVVVQLDRIGYGGTIPNWEHTLRFKVGKDMEPIPSSAVPGFGSEVDMGDRQSLYDFITWARGEYPAKKFALIIADHGDGWRSLYALRLAASVSALASVARLRSKDIAANESILSAEPSATPAAPEEKLPLSFSADSTVRSVSFDETNNDKLYNREAQQAIEDATRGDRLELVGFDSCLMAMVETAYAMRGGAKVMVSSEELEPESGWNYTRWLEQLVANPDMDGPALARVLVASYEAEMTRANNGETTLSAIDLTGVEGLSSAISELSAELSAKLDAEAPHVVDARGVCIPYGAYKGYMGVDIGLFAEQLISLTGDEQVRQKAEAVRAALSLAVIQNYAGRFRRVGVERQGRMRYHGSNGLALYFPEDKTQFQLDVKSAGYLDSNTDFPVEFVQKHRWDNFLQAYYAHPR